MKWFKDSITSLTISFTLNSTRAPSLLTHLQRTAERKIAFAGNISLTGYTVKVVINRLDERAQVCTGKFLLN